MASLSNRGYPEEVKTRTFECSFTFHCQINSLENIYNFFCSRHCKLGRYIPDRLNFRNVNDDIDFMSIRPSITVLRAHFF